MCQKIYEKRIEKEKCFESLFFLQFSVWGVSFIIILNRSLNNLNFSFNNNNNNVNVGIYRQYNRSNLKCIIKLCPNWKNIKYKLYKYNKRLDMSLLNCEWMTFVDCELSENFWWRFLLVLVVVVFVILNHFCQLHLFLFFLFFLH